MQLSVYTFYRLLLPPGEFGAIQGQHLLCLCSMLCLGDWCSCNKIWNCSTVFIISGSTLMGAGTTVSDRTWRQERLLGQCHCLGEEVRGWRTPPRTLAPTQPSFAFLKWPRLGGNVGKGKEDVAVAVIEHKSDQSHSSTVWPRSYQSSWFCFPQTDNVSSRSCRDMLYLHW